MVKEIEESLLFWIHCIQSEVFQDEVAALTKGEPLPKGSSLLPLQPYLCYGADFSSALLGDSLAEVLWTQDRDRQL